MYFIINIYVINNFEIANYGMKMFTIVKTKLGMDRRTRPIYNRIFSIYSKVTITSGHLQVIRKDQID